MLGLIINYQNWRRCLVSLAHKSMALRMRTTVPQWAWQWTLLTFLWREYICEQQHNQFGTCDDFILRRSPTSRCVWILFSLIADCLHYWIREKGSAEVVCSNGLRLLGESALCALGFENTGLRADSAAASKCMQEMLHPPPTTGDKWEKGGCQRRLGTIN